MSQQLHVFSQHAAALQCVAEDFRRAAADRSSSAPEFERYAGVLDHIAASLIVGDGRVRDVKQNPPRLGH